MPYEVEETGELTRTANVTVPSGKYHKKVNKALRELSGRVKVRGFRKGKIPLNVMRKRYGQAVTRDVVEELVSENMTEILGEMGNVLHVSTPQVTKIPLDDDGALEFTVDVELRPAIDPIGYLGLEVEKPKAEFDKDTIDQELEKMRENLASLEPIALRTTVNAGDIVTVDIRAVGESPDLEALKGDDVQIEVGAGDTVPGIDEALEGAEFGSTVDSEIELNEGFPAEELRGQTVPIRLTLKKVERRVLPEIDDDFAQQTGEGETLLELRGNIRERLEEEREKEAASFAEENMIARLLEQNEFDLPPQFLEEQLQKAAEQRLQMFRQQGLDPSQFGLDAGALKEEIRDTVTRQIKAELLIMEISQKEKIKVEEEDILAFFEETASQMGVNVQQYLGFMRQNPDMMRQAQASVLMDKTKKHLLSEASIKEVEWPEEDDVQDVLAEQQEEAEVEVSEVEEAEVEVSEEEEEVEESEEEEQEEDEK